jgi:hypothetical protein
VKNYNRQEHALLAVLLGLLLLLVSRFVWTMVR